MDPTSDFLAQLLNPSAQRRPFVPYDTSQMPGDPNAPPGAMGQNLPAKLQAALQQEAQAGQAAPPATPAYGLPADGGATTLSGPKLGSTAGYVPQPRMDLPRALTNGQGSDLFTGYRDRYSPAAPPDDPMAALLGTQPAGPGPGAPAPPSQALTPPWAAQPGQQQIQQHVQEHMPLSASEKALLRKSSAYGRTISRLRDLDRLRAERGM